MTKITRSDGVYLPTPSDGTWIARVFGNTEPHTLVQDPTGALYAPVIHQPDIWHIAGWIARQPGVYRLADVDPRTDSKHTRRYDEYRFMTFPF